MLCSAHPTKKRKLEVSLYGWESGELSDLGNRKHAVRSFHPKIWWKRNGAPLIVAIVEVLASTPLHLPAKGRRNAMFKGCFPPYFCRLYMK